MELETTKNYRTNFDEDRWLAVAYDRMGQPEILNEIFYAFDKPISYKDLTLYPVTMKHCTIFTILSNCLTIRKNGSGDIRAITMSYLDYIFYLSFEKNKEYYAQWLISLLELCLHKGEYVCNGDGEKVLRKGKPISTIEIFVNEEGKYNIAIFNLDLTEEYLARETDGFDKRFYHIYDSTDFTKIREIICKQNNLEIPDETIHPDIQAKIDEYDEIQRRKNKDEICSLESQINLYMTISGLPKHEIEKLSIRAFGNAMERLGIFTDYCLATLLSPNMDKKDRKKILSWLGKSKKLSKLDKIKTDYSSFADKFDMNKIKKKEIN